MTDRLIFKSPVNNRAACVHRTMDSISMYHYDLLEYTGEVGGLPVFKIVKEKVDLSGFLEWLGIDVVTHSTTGMMFGEKRGT